MCSVLGNITVFWDLTPRSLVDKYQRSGEVYNLHIQRAGTPAAVSLHNSRRCCLFVFLQGTAFRSCEPAKGL